MEKTSLHLFRLRLNEQIVGYMRYVKPAEPYFSKDRFWWKAQPLEYLQKDSYSEFFDLNQQWIFEFDIVEFKPRKKFKPTILGVVLFDDQLGEFVAVDISNFVALKQSEWLDYSLKLMSYLFINTDLQKELVERGWVI